MVDRNRRPGDGIKYVDFLRALWGITDHRPRESAPEPGSYSTDIYAQASAGGGGALSRRRTDWPY